MIVHKKAYGKFQVKARYKEMGGPEIVKKSFTLDNQTESDNPTGKTYPTFCTVEQTERINTSSLLEDQNGHREAPVECHSIHKT